ncbi:hypothetical protein ES703_18943 [subsurface metagenome]
MATKTITLDPSESREVAFTFTPSVAKVHVVSVDGLSGSFQALGPVGVAQIYTFRPLTSSWRVGDTVYIWGSAWVFNKGDGAGEYTEEWYIDDVLVGTNEGYLAPEAYDNNEKIWHNTELRLAPGEHRMHVVLKWNGHEDRYPTTGYSTFEVPL